MARTLRTDDFISGTYSWRDDAYDPATDDAPDTATRRRPIELSPGVWVYPEFLDRLEANRADPFHAAAAWRVDEF